jgi:hypothetical protein
MGKLTQGIPGFATTKTESVQQEEQTGSGGTQQGGEVNTQGATTATSWITLPARMVSAHENALKESALGTIAEETNPVPKEVDDGLGIAGEILRDPTKMKILVEYQPVAEILQQEKITNLMSNAEIQHMAKEGDLIGVLNHPSMQTILQDPVLRQSIDKIDLEELLERLKTNEVK